MTESIFLQEEQCVSEQITTHDRAQSFHVFAAESGMENNKNVINCQDEDKIHLEKNSIIYMHTYLLISLVTFFNLLLI